MDILFNKETNSFHLFNDLVSYQLSIKDDKYVSHVYWGKAIGGNNAHIDFPLYDRAFSASPHGAKLQNFSMNTLLQEYPGHNNGDYRESALEVTYPDKTFSTQLEYQSHSIINGKPELEGLPHTYINEKSEAKTLKLVLKDTLDYCTIDLYYTIYADYPVVTRSVRVTNNGELPIELNKLLSMSVDFDHSSFDCVQLPGAWGRERDLVRHPIHRGVHKIDSKRGTTSHTYQPFLGLVDPDTTEHTGDVYGFHFVYSGEFLANCEVNEYNQTRVQMGISPEHFKWELNPAETFSSPEVVMSYTDNGLNQFSQDLHSFYQTHLIRGKYQFEERPVLLNNWEGTYFDFTEEKLLDMADKAVDLGVELFVLDDGWFGKRDDDKTSLGDWVVYDKKLPNGLKSLAEKIKAKGLRFGLWFEPEMISEDSDLFRTHPEWVLKANDRSASLGRNQFILDYTQKEVRDYIKERMRAVLNEVPIDYIKWDFNRNMTEIGSQHPSVNDGEVTHRYMLGLYDLLEELTTAYPDILWESCSGGGGRYDPGMLYYMPQTWTSDNTDAVARLEIQTGTSLVLPISSMGSHVSAVPNHQVNRMTSLDMRGDVAMAGNLGYELDPTLLSDSEREKVQEQIVFYKENRKLIQYGSFFRLKSPFDQSSETAWLFVNKDKSEALVFNYLILDKTNMVNTRVKLKGLAPEKRYKLNGQDTLYYGSELMNKGLYIEPPLSDEIEQSSYQVNGDFRSTKIKIKEVIG
ncbi:MAG: alpha-galactosidase [Alkalibacterium sp.]|nr:alpha-galactosidase [Alkalibacterium sp.]